MLSSQSPRHTTNELLTYFNVAALITLVSGVMYVVGRGYYNSFYSEVGFASVSVILPSASYIREGVMPLAVVATLGLVAFAVKRGPSLPRVIVANATLAVLAILPLPAFWGDRDLFVLFAAVSFLVCVMAVWSTVRRESLARVFRAFIARELGVGATGALLIGVAVLVFLSFAVAVLLGTYQAKALVKSRFKQRQRITIMAKDQSLAAVLKTIAGQELVLIVDHDRKYYVVAMPPHPGSITPYVISADQVAAVRLQPLKK